MYGAKRKFELMANSLGVTHTTVDALTNNNAELALKDTELANKKAELAKKKNRLHNNVKHIWETDDDLSTMQHQLNNIQSEISTMTMNFKKYLSTESGAIGLKYFTREENETHIFEYGVISLLVEKIITDTLIHWIYDKPIYFELPVKLPYAGLSKWQLFTTTKDWSLLLREQFCFLAVRPEIVERLSTLSEIFIGANSYLEKKLITIVEIAAQVSLAMPVKRKKLVKVNDKAQGDMRFQYFCVKRSNNRIIDIIKNIFNLTRVWVLIKEVQCIVDTF
ncbi:hypothetical protein J3Q64DRAFT_1703253 [Phycomyces blakesleeanus]|uniref:Uncharacterized protein n=2 Tax=Phycomyces blakesleeanus TaxID=4837 RepID=A0A167K7L4_PHYB8|nr:hypothetical protein PHYBLDRAFT_69296 [Phycomyces blakesleeanus NRRL 1555(-)]OAD67428.1 hypothetical protein PHYBLDRAFT_69296 [Phycomyces blakesleeanus NRRL 1555(-)]|eukprot:XP_018285468.1 hypothetical protein PHYBLDRAFT_69296 [Phycomyces blakesleeanus NRRL 1555(-)]